MHWSKLRFKSNLMKRRRLNCWSKRIVKKSQMEAVKTFSTTVRMKMSQRTPLL